MFKYYVYKKSPTGLELIGTSTNKARAEEIKAKVDAERQIDDMWSTYVSDHKEQEVCYWD